MDCREFLIEFEDRGALSEPATLHLTICADCKKLSERQTQIWQAIDNFVKINAPNDFDFRVKARIANTRPSDFQSRFLPVLRYVLPVAIVVALVGLIAFNFSYFSNGDTNNFAAIENTPPAVNNSTEQLAFAPSPEKLVEAPKESMPETIQPPLQTRVPQNETAQTSPKERRKSRSSDDDFIGSRDLGITRNKSRIPNGFQINPNSDNEASLLEFDGIKTTLENGKRTVRSVDSNSTAARSGIKVGDVIEKVVGDSITISRGAERIEIKLQRSISQP